MANTLTIDPALVWATFYGGNGNTDGPMSIASDGSSNVYITGYTSSSSATYPTSNPGAPYYFDGTSSTDDAFILKFNSAGARVWATFYGGDLPSIFGGGSDGGSAVAADISGGYVYVGGSTGATNFPVLTLGGAYNQGAPSSGNDQAFLLKFNSSTGSRVWATCYGGSTGIETTSAIAVDNLGNVYIAGQTSSSDFPVLSLAGAYNQATLSAGGWDGFIVKFNSAGATQWATYYPEANFGIEALATDAGNNLYASGTISSTGLPTQALAGSYNQAALAPGFSDIFLLKFSSAGARQWATYYGGSGDETTTSLVTDASDNLYVVGGTGSTDLPLQNLAGAYNQTTRNGGSDAFILKFNSSGTWLWGTYFGGSGGESPTTNHNIAIAGTCGTAIVYVTMQTSSTDAPVLSNGAGYNDATFNGVNDAFITAFDNASGAQLWGTYFGGDAKDYREVITTDGSNNLIIAGEWPGTGAAPTPATYPLTTLAGGYNDATPNGGDDTFIAKFTGCPAPLPIELLNFTGNCVAQNSILLHWSTASETNNDYFTIERSADAVSWETAGTVKGAGNSSFTRSYEFTDLLRTPDSQLPTLYYRLKQTDYDGKSETFNNQQVAVDVTECAVKVFPNPAGNTLNIPYTAEQDGEITLQVYDVIGKLVKQKLVVAVKGNNKFTMDLSTVAQGMYVLRVKGTDKENNQKFVKQ